EFELACAAALSVYLLANLSNDRKTRLSFEQAADWFLGNDADTALSLTSLAWPRATALAQLGRIPYDARLLDLLPFDLAVLVTGPVGTSRAADMSHRNDRQRKRERGSFYTPSDVAEYIVGASLSAWEAYPAAVRGPRPA